MSVERGRPAIVWVNQYAVPPSEPGGTRHFDLASALIERGWDVELVVGDLGLESRAYARRRRTWDVRAIRATEGNVPFRFLWASPYRRNDWRRLASMLTFGGAVAVDLLVRPSYRDTVLVGSSPHLFAAFGTWVAAVIRRRPFVLEVCDLWPETYVAMTGASPTSVQVRLLQWVADVLYRHADAIVVLAEGSAPAIAARGADPRRIVHVPNGVDLAAFDLPARSPRAADDPVRFVYAGAHGPANGLDLVVDACGRLSDEGVHDIEVVLVGDGPAKEALVATAAALGLRNLSFRDPVPKSSIPALLSTMDAGLMVLAEVPLFAYAVSPNKLFDYLAAELPVVTNVPGLVADIVERSGAGIACAPGDGAALAGAMRALADGIRSGTASGAGGRAFVAASFDRPVLAGRLDELFSGLLGTGSAR